MSCSIKRDAEPKEDNVDVGDTMNAELYQESYGIKEQESFPSEAEKDKADKSVESNKSESISCKTDKHDGKNEMEEAARESHTMDAQEYKVIEDQMAGTINVQKDKEIKGHTISLQEDKVREGHAMYVQEDELRGNTGNVTKENIRKSAKKDVVKAKEEGIRGEIVRLQDSNLKHIGCTCRNPGNLLQGKRHERVDALSKISTENDTEKGRVPEVESMGKYKPSISLARQIPPMASIDSLDFDGDLLRETEEELLELENVAEFEMILGEEMSMFHEDNLLPQKQEEEEKEVVVTFPYGNLIPGIRECEICLEEGKMRRYRKCCGICVCDNCLKLYFTFQVESGIIRIGCINNRCKQFAFVEEIMCRLPDKWKNKYYRFLVDANNDPYIKTCPRCNFIQHVSEEELNSRKKKMRKFGYQICCPDCKLMWCFPCHAPWHANIKCKDFLKGDKLVKSWAKEIHYGQKNASKCPKCKVFIERSGGCNHMVCEKCHTSFCYKCGERYYKIKFIGDHYGKYSPFGCKYKFFPEKPALRKTIRGSLLGLKLLGSVVLGAFVVMCGALFVAVSPVVVPVYFGHKLHFRYRMKKRRKTVAVRIRAHTLPDILGQVVVEKDRPLSDNEMTSSQSSSDSSVTYEVSREDEVLRVGVEGQSSGSENVSVWIHQRGKERKKHQVQLQRSKDDTSVELKDDREVVVTDWNKDCQTTAKITPPSGNQDVMLLHVVTKSTCKDSKLNTSDSSSNPLEREKHVTVHSPGSNFVIEEEENTKSTNGCFVKLFGKKLPTVLESNIEKPSTVHDSGVEKVHACETMANDAENTDKDVEKDDHDEVINDKGHPDSTPDLVKVSEIPPFHGDDLVEEVDPYYGLIAKENMETSL